MKAWLVILCVLVAGLALTLVGTVAAQPLDDDGPPGPMFSPDRPGGDPDPRFAALTDADALDRYALPAAALGAPSSPAVTIGQPGLSFRYVRTFGVTEAGYLTDGQHLNAPSGLFIDGSNNLYVVEEHGYRLLRFNSAGVNTLAVGTASLCIDSINPVRFCTPQDVALDGDGNIWVATGNRVVQLNASGAYLQQLPVPSSSGSWSSGNDNTHFNSTGGVAFDNAAGRMFVADRNNHRVQVYTFSGSTPVYNATIGVTGSSGNDNSHFNRPERLAVDSSGRLYVVDANNRRVQRCTLSGTWSCSPFGSGAGVSQPRGISLDSADNVYLHDSDNGRVAKCASDGSCVMLITAMNYSLDVVVDSAGNVYAGRFGHGAIQKYSSTGGSLGDFIGTSDMSFIPDATHIYSPWGIAVAADGSLYVAERWGYRFRKLDTAGVEQWAIGRPGGWSNESTALNTLEGKPAIASDGRVFLPDTGNNRVQIFRPDGAYLATFGSYGTSGNDKFNGPAGIALHPGNGDIYIADQNNHRVQVYDSSFGYKATLGVTGVSGNDATHFNSPSDVAVDASGGIYVADRNNHRIQKCALNGVSGTCTTFAGITGVSGSDFDHLGSPRAVVVDGAGRVYVADEWNHRVQVFDAAGAYLTTIGGSWGPNTGQLRSPSGIALDSAGNVYVADRENHRIQKFAPGVPGWRQVNINGFGERQNQINPLASFGGQLYAGTFNFGGSGAQLWRMDAGGDWTAVITDGFGSLYNIGVVHLAEFNGLLYAATWAEEVNGGEIWRSGDGVNWTRVVSQGFGDPVYRLGHLAVFSNTLYAGTWSYTTTHSAEIWRSSDGGNWTRVVSSGLGDATNLAVPTMEVFNGALYAGTYCYDFTMQQPAGCEVWRTADGLNWTRVITDGFGDMGCLSVGSLAVFQGHLYASTSGAIWRCSAASECDQALDWTRVVTAGFSNPNNRSIGPLIESGSHLYAVVGNRTTGMEIWRTSNGTNWEPVSIAGLGDSNNTGPYSDHSAAVYNNRLFIGTTNNANGGEIWMKTLTADFAATPTRGAPPLTVQFTNTSAGDFTTSQWDFGDGGTSTAVSPTHTYTAVGTYTVTLMVGDGTDTSAITKTKAIWVGYAMYLPVVMKNYNPYLYDDFNDPAYDGAWNPDLWSWATYSDSWARMQQQNGALVVWNITPSSAGGAQLLMRRPPLRSPQRLWFLEARMRMSSDRTGDSSVQLKGYTTVNGHGWTTVCSLSGTPNFAQAWFDCGLMVYQGENLVFEYKTTVAAIPYDAWHVARIEIIPDTSELRFYLNDTLLGTHVPDDAEGLKQITEMRPNIHLWNGNANATSTRYVDDVRITPAR